jgi:hypothetical protein
MKRRYFGFVGCPNIEGLRYNCLKHRRAYQSRYW